MFSGQPIDLGPIFGPLFLLLLVASLILLPIGLVWRARQGVRHFRRGYYEGRTAGMTDAELDAFENREPVLFKFWPVLVAFCLILLCIIVPHVSPVVIVIWLARLFNSKKTQRTLRDEYSSVRPGSVLGLGDSARERDRGRPDAE